MGTFRANEITIMELNTNLKPSLSKKITPEVFKSYYWYKKELVEFCVKNKIPSTGGKLELAARIEKFLYTGMVDAVTIKKRLYGFDSEKVITPSKRVINFRCDSKTREFFTKEIGRHFRFNEFLRRFAKIVDYDGHVTYGELADLWSTSEAEKKNAKVKSSISKQFQFNQFQRDFFNANKNATRTEMLNSWEFIKSCAGPATYEHYLELINK